MPSFTSDMTHFNSFVVERLCIASAAFYMFPWLFIVVVTLVQSAASPFCTNDAVAGRQRVKSCVDGLQLNNAADDFAS